MAGGRGLHVWGVGTARTIRPHWVLAELGLAYESHEIIPRTASMSDGAFLARSRRGKVPILEDDELVIGESGAIALHLADTRREGPLLSPAPATRARAEFHDVCFFTLMELDAPLYVVRRHAGLPEVYGAAPVAVTAAKAYFERQAGELAARLANGGPYLMGEAFSVADVLLASCLTWAVFAGIELPRGFEEYQAHITTRKAYAAAMRVNFPPAALAALARGGAADPAGAMPTGEA